MVANRGTFCPHLGNSLAAVECSLLTIEAATLSIAIIVGRIGYHRDLNYR